jgi:hypothetical protein
MRGKKRKQNKEKEKPLAALPGKICRTYYYEYGAFPGGF